QCRRAACTTGRVRKPIADALAVWYVTTQFLQHGVSSMRYVLCTLLCVLPVSVCAQDKKDKKPGDEMIEKYLNAEADKLSAKFLDGAKTIDEWKKKRPRLYQEYMDMLGLCPIPEKTPLKATKTGEVEAHGVVVEKIHFQSKPGLYVTANLYRPKDDASAKRKRLPAVLYVCG